jgi:hypothetical protein
MFLSLSPRILNLLSGVGLEPSYYWLSWFRLKTLEPKLGVVVHAYNRSTWEAEAQGSWVLGQPGLRGETLSQKAKTNKQKKEKKNKQKPQPSTKPASCFHFASREGLESWQVKHFVQTLPIITKLGEETSHPLLAPPASAVLYFCFPFWLWTPRV